MTPAAPPAASAPASAPAGGAPPARPAGAPGPWLVGPAFDGALLLAPGLATLAALLLVAPAEDPPPLSLPLFLLLVVAFDVAHVWATLYLGYLDREAFARRRALLALTPLAVWVAGLRVHLASPTLFWTLLAYVAIHHFAAQQWGFVALYKARAGERDPLDRSLDKAAVWTGALGPVLLWHTTDQAFDWFGHGEAFLLRLDPALRPDLVAVMALVGGAWLARQAWHLRRGTLVVGKAAWVVAAWLSWSVGLWNAAERPIVGLAAINLLHGLPFLGLVLVRVRRRWAAAPPPEGRPPPVMAVLAGSLPLFYGVLLALACAEEFLWEGLVWHDRVRPLLALPLEPVERAAVVAALATPQTAHYALDAFLWRLDGTNPDLEAALAVGRGATPLSPRDSAP